MIKRKCKAKDTSKGSRHSCSCKSNSSHKKYQTPEEQIEVLFSHFGPQVVHKSMDLTKSKYTKSL